MRAEPYKLTIAGENITTATDTDLVAAVSGFVIQVWRVVISGDVAQDYTFKTGTTALDGGTFHSVTGVVLGYEGQPWFETAAGAKLAVTTSGADDCHVCVWYTLGQVSHTVGRTAT